MTKKVHPDKRSAERKKRRRILRVKCGNNTAFYDATRKKAVPALINDSYLKEHADSNVRRYSDKEKQKTLHSFVKKAKKTEITVPTALPNAGRKIKTPDNGKRSPSATDFARGALALLKLPHLFPALLTGYNLLADLLIAMRCSSIRHACRGSVRFVTEFRQASSELIELLIGLINLSVSKKRWKDQDGKKWKGTIRRNCVLDYREQDVNHPFSIIQFARIKIRLKHRKALWLALPYADTAAIVIGASQSQAKEAVRQMEDAVVLLVNSVRPEGVNADSIKADSLNLYNPSIAKQITSNAPCIRALLRRWWESPDMEENRWADALVKRARARLKSPGQSDYVILSPNPSKLRHAIRCEVLLAFLDEAEPAGFLPSVDVPALRNEIENVFYPKPVEEAAARRIEDPGVFLPLMRKLVLDKSSEIVPETDHFVNRNRLFGARREISRVLHLVIPESVWAQEYRKAAKANGIDVSFCRKDGWERELQKLLCKEELIKSGGSNPRYRYDLYENGTKDTTCVVAVPWESVRPGGDDAGKTPGNDTNGGQGGLPAALPEASGASATSTIWFIEKRRSKWKRIAIISAATFPVFPRQKKSATPKMPQSQPRQQAALPHRVRKVWICTSSTQISNPGFAHSARMSAGSCSSAQSSTSICSVSAVALR